MKTFLPAIVILLLLGASPASAREGGVIIESIKATMQVRQQDSRRPYRQNESQVGNKTAPDRHAERSKEQVQTDNWVLRLLESLTRVEWIERR